MNEWRELIVTQPAEMESPLLSRGVQALGDFLEGNQGVEGRLREIMARRLGGRIDADTWQLLENSLASYMGEDAAGLLLWTSAQEQLSRLDLVQDLAPPAVNSLLRDLVSLYGPELERTYAVWNEIPEGWRTIFRKVHYDLINQQHVITLRIEKFNGEVVTLEGTANTIMDLTTQFLETLRFVGAEGFNPERVQAFLEKSRVLFEMLVASEEEAEEPA